MPLLMSAFTPKANIGPQSLHVRFGSKADICSAIDHVRFTPESDAECVHSNVRYGPIANSCAASWRRLFTGDIHRNGLHPL